MRNDLGWALFSPCVYDEIGSLEPCGCAVFRSLAEEESQLFERLGEGILARHDEYVSFRVEGKAVNMISKHWHQKSWAPRLLRQDLG